MTSMVLHGLYIIKDSYFSEFRNPYWMDNKNEHRPYYYLIKDSDGIDWVIPLSSQVDNYKKKIEQIESNRGAGNCIYYHIGEIASIERVFLIGDMFPVEEKYIKAPFTIGRVHYIVQNDSLNRVIYSKAMRYLNLVKSGKMHSRNNIMGIKKVILNRKESSDFLV